MKVFIEDRLKDDYDNKFFQPTKKLNLKTFSVMKKTINTSVKDKALLIKSHSKIVGQLEFSMQ